MFWINEKDLSSIGNDPYTRKRDNPLCIIKDNELEYISFNPKGSLKTSLFGLECSPHLEITKRLLHIGFLTDHQLQVGSYWVHPGGGAKKILLPLEMKLTTPLYPVLGTPDFKSSMTPRFLASILKLSLLEY